MPNRQNRSSLSNSALRAIFQAWFDGLPTHSNNDRRPARGSIAACLVVSDALRTNPDLELNAHLTPGKAQIKGLARAAVKRILARHGEFRKFLGEGGRTNRGVPGDVESMLHMLSSLGFENLDEGSRGEVLDALQLFLVEAVRDFHNRQRISISVDPSKSTWSIIHHLLIVASNKAGPVAQYLVGAKLQLRFPEIVVSNDRFSAADAPSGRQGDFLIGDTAFHVTMVPTANVLEKCARNLADGFRVFLLVPDNKLLGAKQNAADHGGDKIAVESIESFVANNVEELSKFTSQELRGGLLRLLELYNARVNAVETDKSLMIEIPRILE